MRVLHRKDRIEIIRYQLLHGVDEIGTDDHHDMDGRLAGRLAA